jgi:hypothetical protein
LRKVENRRRESQEEREDRKNQAICCALIDETEKLLNFISRFKGTPAKLAIPVYDKFQDDFWLLPELLARTIRKVYLEIDEANGLLGCTGSCESTKRYDLGHNRLPNALIILRKQIENYLMSAMIQAQTRIVLNLRYCTITFISAPTTFLWVDPSREELT